MPPASLSTFAVMNPGPTTAKNSTIRVFQRLQNFFMRILRRHKVKRFGHERRHRINADWEFSQMKSGSDEFFESGRLFSSSLRCQVLGSWDSSDRTREIFPRA